MIGGSCNHRWRSLGCYALLLTVLLGPRSSLASDITPEMRQSITVGDRNHVDLLRYLVPALQQAGKAGRIYYTASCPSDKYFLNPFPKLDVRAPSKDASGLAAVREIVRGNTNVEVEENPVGIIKIRIGTVPDELLRTTISHISLDPKYQYDYHLAIDAIESSEEVLAARHKLGFHGEELSHSWLAVQPDKGLPHLPDSLTNITLDQALDLVAQTFKGIVEYGTCPKQGLYGLYFTGGPGFYLWGDEGYQAMDACKNTYRNKLKDFEVIFGLRPPPLVSVSDSEAYFDVKGVVAYTDKTGSSKREEIECKVPRTP
jgi:hypothetical protein